MDKPGSLVSQVRQLLETGKINPSQFLFLLCVGGADVEDINRAQDFILNTRRLGWTDEAIFSGLEDLYLVQLLKSNPNFRTFKQLSLEQQKEKFYKSRVPFREIKEWEKIPISQLNGSEGGFIAQLPFSQDFITRSVEKYLTCGKITSLVVGEAMKARQVAKATTATATKGKMTKEAALEVLNVAPCFVCRELCLPSESDIGKFFWNDVRQTILKKEGRDIGVYPTNDPIYVYNLFSDNKETILPLLTEISNKLTSIDSESWSNKENIDKINERIKSSPDLVSVVDYLATIINFQKKSILSRLIKTAVKNGEFDFLNKKGRLCMMYDKEKGNFRFQNERVCESCIKQQAAENIRSVSSGITSFQFPIARSSVTSSAIEKGVLLGDVLGSSLYGSIGTSFDVKNPIGEISPEDIEKFKIIEFLRFGYKPSWFDEYIGPYQLPKRSIVSYIKGYEVLEGELVSGLEIDISKKNIDPLNRNFGILLGYDTFHTVDQYNTDDVRGHAPVPIKQFAKYPSRVIVIPVDLNLSMDTVTIDGIQKIKVLSLPISYVSDPRIGFNSIDVLAEYNFPIDYVNPEDQDIVSQLASLWPSPADLPDNVKEIAIDSNKTLDEKSKEISDIFSNQMDISKSGLETWKKESFIAVESQINKLKSMIKSPPKKIEPNELKTIWTWITRSNRKPIELSGELLTSKKEYPKINTQNQLLTVFDVLYGYGAYRNAYKRGEFLKSVRFATYPSRDEMGYAPNQFVGLRTGIYGPNADYYVRAWKDIFGPEGTSPFEFSGPKGVSEKLLDVGSNLGLTSYVDVMGASGDSEFLKEYLNRFQWDGRDQKAYTGTFNSTIDENTLSSKRTTVTLLNSPNSPNVGAALQYNEQSKFIPPPVIRREKKVTRPVPPATPAPILQPPPVIRKIQTPIQVPKRKEVSIPELYLLAFVATGNGIDKGFIKLIPELYSLFYDQGEWDTNFLKLVSNFAKNASSPNYTLNSEQSLQLTNFAKIYGPIANYITYSPGYFNTKNEELELVDGSMGYVFKPSKISQTTKKQTIERIEIPQPVKNQPPKQEITAFSSPRDKWLYILSLIFTGKTKSELDTIYGEILDDLESYTPPELIIYESAIPNIYSVNDIPQEMRDSISNVFNIDPF